MSEKSGRCPRLQVGVFKFTVYLTISAKPKYIQFTIIYDQDKQQILAFEKLQPDNFGLFFWLALCFH